MKQKLSYIFTLLVIATSLAIPAVAVAEQSASSSPKADDNTTSIESSEHSMDDRIARFKTEFKVKLSSTETEHIKLKCVGAQGSVSTLKSHFGEKATPRTRAYTELQRRLSALVTKLKDKTVDTTTLEQEVTALNAKITTFNDDLTAYKQTLSDLGGVDCKTDPAGFQAALLAARSAHETLIKDILAIRTYLVNTLRPTLQSIKSQLDKTTSSDSEGSN